jgi:hypothetical protein
MFRKIHSNRDPGVTVWSELRQEFGSYFNRAGSSAQALCTSRPKTLFGLMLALLLLSAVLSFTLFRHPPAPPQKTKAAVRQPAVIEDSFSRILETGAALKQTLTLKKEVETILARGKLSHTDSLALNSALDSLQLIQKQFNHAP